MWRPCWIKCCGTRKRQIGPVPEDGLEQALEDVARTNNHISLWIWWVFLLAGSPGIANAWHLTLIVFIRYEQPHWCKVPELDATGWTPEQIRQISAPRDADGAVLPRNCDKYAWDYTELASKASFEEALAKVEADVAAAKPGMPGTSSCSAYHFLGSGLESEWSLVCDQTKLMMRTALQSAVASGKLIGSSVFGFVADRYGRKPVVVTSCLIYMVASLVSSFTKEYWVFIAMRVATGMAGAGTFNVAFTILTETCHPEQRTILGNLYNEFYPVGLVSLPLIAYIIQDDWQHLQLALSAPTLLLLINCWFLHESPRWLITQGRRDKAWKVVAAGSHGKIVPPPLPPPPSQTTDSEDADTRPFWERFKESQLMKILSSCDLVVRLLLCHFGWFSVAISYYTLSLSADNFGMNRYFYIALLGLVEAVSYVVCVPILKVAGRRLCCAIMFLISAAMLLSMLVLPSHPVLFKFVMAMIGALTITVIYSVIILFTGELFPTEIRNTAVGTSAVLSHLAGILSPVVVDFLGAVAWYIPSVLCGSLLLLGGFLVLLLPETRDKLLDDNVQQVFDNPKNRVSVKNCWACNK